jgi:hypothetical protein
MSVDINRLKKLLESEGIDTASEAFTRALRKFQNPAGCELCGALTKVGTVVPARGKTPSYVKTACCGRKAN